MTRDGGRKGYARRYGIDHDSTVSIPLSSSMKEKIYQAAHRRKISRETLLTKVISAVFDEGLLTAVLDEEVK